MLTILVIHITVLCAHVQSGATWLKLESYDQAEVVLSCAMRYATTFEGLLQEPTTSEAQREEYVQMFFDVYVARLQAAWGLDQQVGQLCLPSNHCGVM